MKKKVIKNITDDPQYGYINQYGQFIPYEPLRLSFKEKGKRIILKPGETYETILNGENIDGKRLRLVELDEKKKKGDD